MMSEPVIVATSGRVTTVTIDREERLNALDHVTVRRLAEVFAQCADGATSVIVLRGAGVKAFSAGDDLKAYAERTPEHTVHHYEAGVRLFDAIEEHPCLVVAAIEGYCLGGGLELAIACDYRIAGAGSSFGLPEVRKLGAIPSWGGLTRLPKLVGLARAKEMVLLGERIGAERAAEFGLVGEVVPRGEAFERAASLAEAYAAEANPHAVALAKRVLTEGHGSSRDAARFLNEMAERVQRESDTFGLPG